MYKKGTGREAGREGERERGREGETEIFCYILWCVIITDIATWHVRGSSPKLKPNHLGDPLVAGCSTPCYQMGHGPNLKRAYKINVLRIWSVTFYVILIALMHVQLVMFRICLVLTRWCVVHLYLQSMVLSPAVYFLPKKQSLYVNSMIFIWFL